MTAFEGEQLLLATDFDNTVALTFEPAPNDMTVERAYEAAVQRILGEKCLALYQAKGGLRNRAPGEIVAELAPELDSRARNLKTEDLIEAKLSTLTSQVGQRLPDGAIWPRATDGFNRFWAAVSDSTDVTTAVTSSGHDDFIRRFYEVQELAPPDIMVTDDMMRPLTARLPLSLCVKPAPLLLDLVHYQWLDRQGVEADLDNRNESRENIFYTGDDPLKDGQLALNAGVRFMLIDPADSEQCWQKVGRAMNLAEYAGQGGADVRQ